MNPLRPSFLDPVNTRPSWPVPQHTTVSAKPKKDIVVIDLDPETPPEAIVIEDSVEEIPREQLLPVYAQRLKNDQPMDIKQTTQRLHQKERSTKVKEQSAFEDKGYLKV